MLYERRHTRMIEDFGGLAEIAPWLATAFVITALASIGLPGTSGFVGEFLALLGTFETHPWTAGIASLGVIFAAYYMLPMVQRIFFNSLNNEANRAVADLSRRELAILTPLIAIMIWVGVQPAALLRRMEPSVQAVLERVQSQAAAAPVGAVEVPESEPGDPPSAPAEGLAEPDAPARAAPAAVAAATEPR
jgi:NADH-quinone oxidoreductase subunit M